MTDTMFVPDYALLGRGARQRTTRRALRNWALTHDMSIIFHGSIHPLVVKRVYADVIDVMLGGPVYEHMREEER